MREGRIMRWWRLFRKCAIVWTSNSFNVMTAFIVQLLIMSDELWFGFTSVIVMSKKSGSFLNMSTCWSCLCDLEDLFLYVLEFHILCKEKFHLVIAVCTSAVCTSPMVLGPGLRQSRNYFFLFFWCGFVLMSATALWYPVFKERSCERFFYFLYSTLYFQILRGQNKTTPLSQSLDFVKRSDCRAHGCHQL